MFSSARVLHPRVLFVAALIAVSTLGVTLGTAATPGGASSFTTFDAPGAGARMYQGTVATAIDPAGNVAGIYLDGSNTEHAFVRTASGTITSFDVGTGSSGTAPIAFDGAGNLMGAYADSSKVIHGFLRTLGGTVTSFDVPAAGTGKMQGTFPVCINPSGVIAGIYLDGNNIAHGFVRAVNGDIATFDAGSTTGTAKSNPGTYVTSIDIGGDVAGSFMDTAGVVHGFVRAANKSITTFDAPNAGTSQDQGTGVIGIDTAGDLGGFYLDASNVVHGFVRVASTGNVVLFDAPGAATGPFMSANGNPNNIGTVPTAMDPAGDISGTYMDANQMVRGFVRLANGTISTYNAPGATPSTYTVKPSSLKANALLGASASASKQVAAHGGILGLGGFKLEVQR